MKKSSAILSSDRVVGTIYALLFLLALSFLAKTAFQSLESSAYDRAMKYINVSPSERIAVIDIDDKSIAELGRWPWSRDLYEHLNQLLTQGGAKVIAYSVLWPEGQVDPGRDYLVDIRSDLEDLAANSALSGQVELASQATEIAAALNLGLDDLDYDARLAASIKQAGNVVLPMYFELGMPIGNPDETLAAHFNAATLQSSDKNLGMSATHVTMPIEVLAKSAFRLGHLNQLVDSHDGTLRSEILAINYYGDVFPSLALATAAASLNLQAGDLQVEKNALLIGPRRIATDANHSYRPVFYASENTTDAFSVDSFTDVFAAKVPADKYRDKIVLIGASAVGIGNRFATPIDADMSPVMVLAHSVSSLLQNHSISRPSWAPAFEWGLLALITLYIIFVLPRLRSRLALLCTTGLVFILFTVGLGFFAGMHQWLHMVSPILFLVGGHLVMTIKRFGVTERLKATSDEAGAESNRMLGLAFQSQGQLDIAFEKFRKCPLDDTMMEPLYTLALDFERKRQFNKAGAIYAYMADHNDQYRDLQQRLKRSQSLDETTILGQGSAGGPTRLLIDEEGGMEKPMLGRYLVERELGRGAMGTVYLGRDPKINRVVAIKTIALSEEFDEEDLAGARERFFREAETAGRLNHPDIVTVFDAGEELDLAYIAMEFLEGEEMSRYTSPDQLLPINTVLKAIARVAEALSYAHTQDVVHRDIKPANIMFNEATSDLKITDFGIARLTNSSKTKTGIVLGTPSYMSPEQLAGQTVTGKSDLFSLAVTLFQLLTGQLPFRADSMATLMFKIANEPHIPLHAVRPELSNSLAKVIDTALEKDPANRYDNGVEMAHDIRECLQHVAA